MLACAIHQDDDPDLIRRIILASIRIQQEYHPVVRKSIILFHIHIKRLTATFIILVDQDDKTSIILVFNHKAELKERSSSFSSGWVQSSTAAMDTSPALTVDAAAVITSATNQSGAGQSAIDKSAAGQGAIDQSVAGQSAINQSAAGQKAIDQSAAGHPDGNTCEEHGVVGSHRHHTQSPAAAPQRVFWPMTQS